MDAFYSYSSRSARNACYSSICGVLTICLWIDPAVTPSKIIGEFLGTDFFVSEFVITWHVGNRQTSWNVYISEFIFYSNTIHGWHSWSTNIDIMNIQCTCESLISLSTHSTWELFWDMMQKYSKTKSFSENPKNGTVFSFLLLVIVKNRNGMKIYKYKDNWVGDEILTDYYTLGIRVLICEQFRE